MIFSQECVRSKMLLLSFFLSTASLVMEWWDLIKINSLHAYLCLFVFIHEKACAYVKCIETVSSRAVRLDFQLNRLIMYSYSQEWLNRCPLEEYCLFFIFEFQFVWLARHKQPTLSNESLPLESHRVQSRNKIMIEEERKYLGLSEPKKERVYPNFVNKQNFGIF